MSDNSNTRSDAYVDFNFTPYAPGDRLSDEVIAELLRRMEGLIDASNVTGDAVVSQSPPEDKTVLWYIADSAGVPTGEAFRFNTSTSSWESTTEEEAFQACLFTSSNNMMREESNGCWSVRKDELEAIVQAANLGISVDADNQIVFGTDANLYVPPPVVPIISTDADNEIITGTDAGWYVPYPTPQPSTDAGNAIIIGTDNRYYGTSPIIKHGWAQYEDTTYTSGSPLAVNNARVKVLIDGLGVSTIKTQLPAGVTDFWNTTTDKMEPVEEEELMYFRLTYKCTDGASVAHYDVQLDIGGGIGVILEETKQTIKGAGITTRATFDSSVFVGATFLSNGGEFYIDTSISGDSIDFWDFNVFISKTYQPI